jgi:molybdenum cofactor cytidylyltransferase
MIHMTVAAIILAAGASRRLGEPKQLLRFKQETLLDRAIRSAAESGASPIFVVVGAHWERLSKAVNLGPAILVLNEKWKEGIASSLRSGLITLEAKSADSSGALLMTCDQPFLDSAHLRSLLERFADHKGSRIIASSYAGTVGTPAIFPAAIYARLRALEGERGARVVLAEEFEKLVCVPFEHGEIDIDLPEDKAYLS